MSDTPEPHYNPIFGQFVTVDQTGSDQLRGMVAYCLYKIAKREWATEFFQREKRKPNDGEIKEYTRSWTATRIAGAVKEADATLADFAGTVIEENAPQIRENALRGTFRGAVSASVTGAFLYTLLLIGALVVAQIAGVDLLSIITQLSSST